MAELFLQLKEIHQDHSKTNAEKEQLLRSLIFPTHCPGDHDLLVFFLFQRTAPLDLLIAGYQSIEHYSHLFLDIIQSPHFIEWLSWLNTLPKTGTERDQLLSSSLTMIRLSWKLNIDHRPVPQNHLLALIDFALNSCLTSTNLIVAEQASRLCEGVISNGVSHLSDYVRLLQTATQEQLRLQQQRRDDGTIIFRYLSLGAALSEVNESIAEEVVVKGGLIHLSFTLCQSSDVLLAINALDILTKFAKTRVGLDELCKETVLDWLITVSCGSEGGEGERRGGPDPFLESEGLRVLGEIFRQAASHSSRFVSKINQGCVMSFLAAIHRYLEDGDEVHKIAGLDLISDFAMISSQSLAMLQSYRSGGLISQWLSLLNSAKVELHAAALTGLVRVFDQSDEQFVKNGVTGSSSASEMSVFAISGAAAGGGVETVEVQRVTDFKKSLYQKIGEVKRVATVHYLVKAARQPVTVLRNAAMDLLRAVAAQRAGGWGLRVLFNNGYNPSEAEFWGYLRDRTTEFEKEGKDFKFALIQTVQTSSFHELLGEEIVNQLQVMVAQGAYYMPPRLEELETL